LAFPIGLAFLERLVRGMLDYSREQENWMFTRAPEALSPSIEWLRDWPGDGAFILVTTPEDRAIARKLRMPVVNLAGHLAEAGVPSVTVDHFQIGQVAAEHLLERRFRRFGFYGTRAKWFSVQRCEGFVGAVRRAGCSCTVLEVEDMLRAGTKWTDEEKQLEKWLRQMTPPVGILASTDLRATMLLDVCHRLGLRVPEEVALVGVDNDVVACELCDPPLSSVSRNDWKVGWIAGELLSRLMEGAPESGSIKVAPEGVIPRRSSETLAIEDPEIAAIVQRIRQDLDQPFGVERLLEGCGLSRRRLEHRFRLALGCSPYAFINAQRVERAKRLLTDGSRKQLTKIAADCGFRELRRFRIVFRRLTNLTPGEYRKQLRASGP